MKAIILESPKRNMPQKNAPSPRQVNAHEVAHLVECLHGNELGYKSIADAPCLGHFFMTKVRGAWQQGLSHVALMKMLIATIK